MLTKNQKSKMVYDVRELKEYFDNRFNELKTHRTLITTHLKTLKVRLNQICKNYKIKYIIKSKHWNQTRNSFSSK